MFGIGLTLCDSDAEVIHISEVARSHAATLLRRLPKELDRKARVLAHTETPNVCDAQVNLCANKSSGHGTLEPPSGASRIPLHSNPRLVEIADFLLSSRIS